jgi:phosphate transport system permease protein
MIATVDRLQDVHGLSRARRTKDRVFTGAMWVCGFLAMLPLLFIAGYVLVKGIPAINTAFFTKTPSFAGDANQGISEAFVGTGMIVGLSVLFSVPLGLLAGIYLSEYGRGRTAGAIRFVAEVLLSTPSIVAGAFIWGLVVVRMHTFSAFAAGLALTVLMWPIIARATEEVLRLVPEEYREGALALGLPRWRVVLRIVVPTAGAGIFTAIMLAVARGLGETAPVLLTAFGNDFMNTNPFRPTDAVSLRVFNYAQLPDAQFHTIAWGGAIMLLVAVLVLSITARILSVRQQRRLG